MVFVILTKPTVLTLIKAEGFCSPKVAKQLKLQSMPQSFVLDEHQKIVKIGMNAHQIQRFIAKNTLSN